jgi:curli biogenesis system outer membrane secretion channel CsgG
LLLALAAAALAGGCSSKTQGSLFVHPNADLSTYQRVAVLPLENLTTDRFAGERVREILVIELSAEGLFEVVEPGEVNRVLKVQNVVSVDDLGPPEIAQIGTALGAQALMLGSVGEYRERRSGTLSAPDIAVTLRLIDVETGLVVWSVSDARTGVSTWTRLFGVGERSQSDVARELVRELVGTLYL